MATTISVRLDDRSERALDQLVQSVRVYYEEQGKTFPAAATMAQDVTRSSALRDLLIAWGTGTVEFLPTTTEGEAP